ncbi:TPA: Gfo/Idh/MocA family oxidoreductase [Candidatus Poribacteria bacterium]|nr:Gfo/Idh/MocA family oxidoreductase [Candidatus Poribacteria bacterium]
MEKIKVGIIGSGGIFRGAHAPYYEISERAKIVAVSDVSEQAAKEQAERFNADAYTDFRHILDRRDIDAVDVCTHPAPHRDIAVAAAKAEKHILVEKPMCRNIAEADEMIAAADEAKVMLQVAYVLRFEPNHMKLKQLLDDGILGDVHIAYCSQVGWFDPSRHPWLFIKEQSGGMLVEQAIHNLDAWLWLYGPASSVYAQTSTVPLGGTYPETEKAVENNAIVVFKFQNGGSGMLIKSWAAEVQQGGEGVVCSKGSAAFVEPGLRWKLHGAEEETFSGKDVQRPMSSKGYSIEHWLKCIAGEEKPTTSGRVGRAGIEMAEAAYRSAGSGMPVSLPL